VCVGSRTVENIRTDKMATKNEQILSALRDLEKKLDTHITENVELGKKTESMYKLFVTGNGQASFQERLRNNEKWISGEKKYFCIVTGIIIGDIVIRVWDKIYPT